jgi:hypothetical protein
MGALLPWVKWQGSEADHLPSPGAEVAHIHAFMVRTGTTVPVFLMLLGRSNWLSLLQILGSFYLEFMKVSVTKASMSKFAVVAVM